MLKSFSVENYRAFAQKQNIELRPLTLFFGWNSGGKSALVRFLPLLAESLKTDGPPIWLGGEVGREASWPSIICKATGRSALGFSLAWSDSGGVKAEWRVNGDVGGLWQEVENITITTAGDEVHVTGDGHGLLPDVPEESFLWSSVSAVRQPLDWLKNDVQWLAGVRSRAPRYVSYSGGTANLVSFDGSNAMEHLVAARSRSVEDPVIQKVREFFNALNQELIVENPFDAMWRVALSPVGGPNVSVDLCDTGEGFSQVFPVLVALANASNGGPELLCLEQPELHLHTRAQIELAKQLAATAMSGPNVRLLVETHSEILLTSIQLELAEGRIKPENVRVYWVEGNADGTSTAIPVDFNDGGQPLTPTLVGAFGEATRLGQQLVEAQLASIHSRNAV